jgi:hypothetical protein
MESSTAGKNIRVAGSRNRMARATAPVVGALGLWMFLPGSSDPRTPDSREQHASLEPTPRGRAAEERGAGDVELASHEVPGPVESEQAPPDVDERNRRRAVGVWEDDYHGRRRLTVRADGTATMVVEPSGIGRKLFAERLQFEIDWTISDGRIVMTTTAGEPKSKAQLVLKLYGNRAEYSIVRIDDDQMLLLDADGKTEYPWRHVETSDVE